MNFLYRQFPSLRVFLLRRRLQKMGFCEATRNLPPKDNMTHEKLILDWLKVGLTALAILSMWIIFWLRAVEPVVVPPPAKPVLPAPSIHQPFTKPTVYVL